MALHDINSSNSDLPSPASIALAIAVVRSKPPELNIGEYIDKINDTLLLSRPGHVQQDASAAFWKAEYHRAILEQHDMEDEISRLRSDIEMLKINGKHPEVSKATARPATKANTQTKRQTLEKDLNRTDKDDEIQIDANDDPDIRALLRHLHHLNQSETSSESLTNRLAALCVHLNKLLLQPEELAPRMAGICECVYAAFVRIHDRSDIDDNQFNNRCSRFIQIFRTALNLFHQVATDEALRRDEEEQRKKKRHKSNTRVAKSTAQEDEETCKVQLQAFTRIMSVMFNCIDIDRYPHHWLYEGLASSLLDYLGSIVSYLVFFDPEMAEGGISPVEGLADHADLEPSRVIATAELEAPYLIKILSVMLKKPRTEAAHSKERPTGKSTKDRNTRQKILHRIEERLQNTLMRGIFGDDDESFQDAFWRAQEIDDGAVEPDVDLSENESEHFIGRIWELLGWDILAGKMSTTADTRRAQTAQPKNTE